MEQLLQGTRVFVVRHFDGAVVSSSDSSEEIPVEKLLTQSDLTMVEIDPKTEETKTLLKQQRFYGFLEVIIYLVTLLIFSQLISVAISLPFLKIFAASSSWNVVLLSAVFLFSLQLQLLVLFRNGVKDQQEVELVVMYAMICFLILTFLQVGGYQLLSDSLLVPLSLHAKALILQLSSDMSTVPRHVVRVGVVVVFNAFFSVLTSSFVVPSLRFTLTLFKMTLGRPFEKVSSTWITLLSIDFLSPLILAILFSPGLSRRAVVRGPEDCADSGTTCPATLTMSPVLLMQMVSVFVFVAIKLAVFRKHVQSFMDFSVETASLCLMVGEKDPQMKKALLFTIVSRTSFMVPVALEYLLFPIQLLCLGLLFLHSNPLGLGNRRHPPLSVLILPLSPSLSPCR